MDSKGCFDIPAFKPWFVLPAVAMMASTDLVERPPHVDWTALDDLVHNIRDGLREVRVSELKENRTTQHSCSCRKTEPTVQKKHFLSN